MIVSLRHLQERTFCRLYWDLSAVPQDVLPAETFGRIVPKGLFVSYWNISANNSASKRAREMFCSLNIKAPKAQHVRPLDMPVREPLHVGYWASAWEERVDHRA